MSAVHKIAAAAVPDLPTASWTNGWRIGNEVVVSGMTVGRSPNRLVSLPYKADGSAIRGSNFAPNTVAMVESWYKSFEGE